MTEIDKLIEDEKRLAIRDRESYCHYSGDPTYAYREGYESGMDKGIEIVLSKWQEDERWRKFGTDDLPKIGMRILLRVGEQYDTTVICSNFHIYSISEVFTEWKPIS